MKRRRGKAGELGQDRGKGNWKVERGERWVSGIQRDGMAWHGTAARHEHDQVAGNKVEITKRKHYYDTISQISSKAKVGENIGSI